ncbi:hypothetical protein DA2_2546 [Desulfovibrio sp. A2]|nr:hypothetical protein DA2_2546 [Desulfovibrio sp. A2]
MRPCGRGARHAPWRARGRGGERGRGARRKGCGAHPRGARDGHAAAPGRLRRGCPSRRCAAGRTIAGGMCGPVLVHGSCLRRFGRVAIGAWRACRMRR